MNSKFSDFFKKNGFTELSPIQKQVEKPLKEGISLVGIAPTGSGKTLAYALPLLEQIMPNDGVQLLVLAPSQELAAQIADVMRTWASLIDLKVVSLIGGANLKRQLERLKKHPEVVVGTPGRVLQLIEDRKLKTHLINTVVIDEADEMLSDSPSLKTIRKIVGHCLADTQLAFFSATKAPILDELHKWFGVQVEMYDVTDIDETQGQVNHYMLEVPTRKRDDMLRRLAHVKGVSGLVFFKQMAQMKEIATKLKYNHVSVGVLSSNESKLKRQQALRDLKAGKITFLLTTDVAARGIDIPNLPCVINFDLPKDANTYIHRVGRTGRMGATGTVINLGNEHDLRNFKQLMSAKDFDIVTGFVYQNKLVTDVNKVIEKYAPVSKKKIKKSNNKAVSPETKRHKKRKRDQKNKGKRRVKKS